MKTCEPRRYAPSSVALLFALGVTAVSASSVAQAPAPPPVPPTVADAPPLASSDAPAPPPTDPGDKRIDAEPAPRRAAAAPPTVTPAPAPPPRPAPAAKPPGEAMDAPRPAYSPFMDTRLTWTFGDDDFLKQTGEALPFSPNASVGDRPQYRLFFDNLNSRFAGRENLSHLVLYKKLPGFFPRLDTEAALVLRVNMNALAGQSNNVNTVFEDAGTYLRAFYRAAGTEEKPEGLGATFYPIDTDRFRLGWLYDISWGGTNARINQSIFPRLQGSAPGAKVQWDGAGWNAYVGFKTASIVEVERRVVDGGSGEGAATDTVRLAQTNYGVLGGGGVDVTDTLRLDVGTGYFQQGRFEDPDVIGARVYTFGFSGRAVGHFGMKVPQSIDFLLYRNDPNAPLQFFKPEIYEPGKTSFAVSLEGTRLMQNLKDFDATGKTVLQPATAAAVQFLLKSGFFRATLSGIYRDVPYVLRNQPSFIPFQTLPKDAKTADEVFGALSLDYHFEGPRLTPGIGFGLQLPSTFTSESVDLSGNDTSRTIVIREQGNIAVLPSGKDRVPIIQSRASLKWDLSQMMAGLVWVQYARDNNATKLELDDSGTVLLRQFIKPDFLGYGVSLQARF